MKEKTITAPEYLSGSSKTLWQTICNGWELDEAYFSLLEIALLSLDRINQARENIEKNGLMIETPTGFDRPNPAVKVEQDYINRFLNAWSKIGLDMEPPREVGRPPAGHIS